MACGHQRPPGRSDPIAAAVRTPPDRCHVIVLDTNVPSEPLEQQPDTRILDWLASLADEAGVTSVSIGELLTGVRALR